MDSQTQAFAHRVGILLAAGLVAVSMVFILAVALLQGDGHALAVASELQPYVLGTMGGLLTLLGVSNVSGAIVQIKQAGATAATASAISAGNPATAQAAASVANASTPAPAQPGPFPVLVSVPSGPTPADIIGG